MHIHTVVNALQLRKSIISKELDSRWLKYMPGWEKIPLNIQASRELYKNLFEAPLPFIVYCLFVVLSLGSEVGILCFALALARIGAEDDDDNGFGSTVRCAPGVTKVRYRKII